MKALKKVISISTLRCKLGPKYLEGKNTYKNRTQENRHNGKLRMPKVGFLNITKIDTTITEKKKNTNCQYKGKEVSLNILYKTKGK